jgi:hypothetical protein
MNAVPASNATQQVLATLTSLDRHEDETLAAYRLLAERTEDDAVRYVVRLLIEDEERHQQLSAEMVRWLQILVDAASTGAGRPAGRRRTTRAFLDTTRHLIDLERDDARELRELRSELRSVPATSLIHVLANLMLDDATRHIQVLRFLRAPLG